MFDTVCCLKNPEISTALWQITNRCNAKCKHCFSYRGVIDSDDWKNVSKVFEKLGTRRVVLTGGEPLLHPDLMEIIQILKAMGTSTTLITNGILVTNKLINELKTTGLNTIDISLQSSNKTIQDAIYGVRGAFDKAINAMDLCNKYEIPFSVSATILPYLEPYLSELIDFAISKGAKSISVNSMLLPVSEAKANACNSTTSALYAQKVIRSKRTQYGEEKIKSSRIFPKKDGFRCPAGRSFWSITSSGEWVPCLLAWEMKEYLPNDYSYLYRPIDPVFPQQQSIPATSCPIMDNAR